MFSDYEPEPFLSYSYDVTTYSKAIVDLTCGPNYCLSVAFDVFEKECYKFIEIVEHNFDKIDEMFTMSYHTPYSKRYGVI